MSDYTPTQCANFDDAWDAVGEMNVPFFVVTDADCNTWLGSFDEEGEAIVIRFLNDDETRPGNAVTDFLYNLAFPAVVQEVGTDQVSAGDPS